MNRWCNKHHSVLVFLKSWIPVSFQTQSHLVHHIVTESPLNYSDYGTPAGLFPTMSRPDPLLHHYLMGGWSQVSDSVKLLQVKGRAQPNKQLEKSCNAQKKWELTSQNKYLHTGWTAQSTEEGKKKRNNLIYLLPHWQSWDDREHLEIRSCHHP